MGLQDSSTQPQAAEDNKYRDRAAARRDMKDEYEAGRFLEMWGCLGYKPLVWVHRCLLDMPTSREYASILFPSH